MESGEKCRRTRSSATVFDNSRGIDVTHQQRGAFRQRLQKMRKTHQNPDLRSKNVEDIKGECSAWVDSLFDGVGWKAVDVTPEKVIRATLQMVNTPNRSTKNTAMILLGAVTVLVIAGFILFVILEIRLWLLEQTLKKQYEQADMD